MTTGPGHSWLADLDYPDDEQIQLDVAAIIERGRQIRRKRLRDRVGIIVLICGVSSTAFAVGRAADAPKSYSGAAIGGQPAHPPTRSVSSHSQPQNSDHFDLAKLNAAPGVPVPRQVPFVVQTEAKLPATYGPLQALAGDPARGGVWYVGTASQVVLFHLSPEGVIKSWPVLSAQTVQPWSRFSARAGLAIARGGTAWIGVESTLVRVNTRTGAISLWSIPSARAAGRRLMASRRRPQEVTALAVGPAGEVAVVLSNSSGVQVLSPARDTWRQVRMPALDDQPQAAGFSRTGTLAVGYRDGSGSRGSSSDVLMDVDAGPFLIAAVADARAVEPYGTSSLLVGVSRPEVVSADATVRSLQVPDGAIDLSHDVLPYVPLPDARLATAVGMQIVSFPANAASASQARGAADLDETAPQECQSAGNVLDNVLEASPAEPAGSASTSCPQGFRMLATDRIGSLWVVRSAARSTVELLTRG